MFSLIEKSKGYLFCSLELSQSLHAAQQQMRAEIEGLEANRLLNTAPADLVAYLVEKYSVEAVRLRREDGTPKRTRFKLMFGMTRDA